jgi:hypothetical protein
MQIEDPAREYILSRGGEATLERVEGRVCCGNLSLPPSVRLGKPNTPHEYYLLAINGVHLYIDNGIRNTTALSVTLAGFLWHKYLAIEGWKIY